MADDTVGPAVCRVCLSGESSIPYMGKRGGEPLISPCHCKGTMGLYHKSCLEHWMYISKTVQCEICKFRFQYGTKDQTFCEYFRLKGWNERGYRNLPGDFFSVLTFTPIATLLVYYCVKTGLEDIPDGRFPTGEIVAMLIIAFLIFTTIVFWYVLTLTYHVQQFFDWQKHHKKVFIIDQLEHSRRLKQERFTSRLGRVLCCFSVCQPRGAFTSIEIASLSSGSSSAGSSHSSSSGFSFSRASSTSNSPDIEAAEREDSMPPNTVETPSRKFAVSLSRSPFADRRPLLTSTPTSNERRNNSRLADIDDPIALDIIRIDDNFSEVNLNTPQLAPHQQDDSRPSEISPRFPNPCLPLGTLHESNI